MKNLLYYSLSLIAVLALTGCASAMSHSGDSGHRYYPGTKASYQMLTSQQTNWSLKPLIILDMPFTVMLDTVLLPWDAVSNKTSLKSQLEQEIPQSAPMPIKQR